MLPLDLYARVRTSCAHCTRDRGCSAHPASPAPPHYRGQGSFWQSSGASRRENAEVCLELSRLLPSQPPVIPGQPAGLGPESITTIGSMDSGPARPGMTSGEFGLIALTHDPAGSATASIEASGSP